MALNTLQDSLLPQSEEYGNESINTNEAYSKEFGLYATNNYKHSDNKHDIETVNWYRGCKLTGDGETFPESASIVDNQLLIKSNHDHTIDIHSDSIK